MLVDCRLGSCLTIFIHYLNTSTKFVCVSHNATHVARRTSQRYACGKTIDHVQVIKGQLCLALEQHLHVSTELLLSVKRTDRNPPLCPLSRTRQHRSIALSLWAYQGYRSIFHISHCMSSMVCAVHLHQCYEQLLELG
jgi:hypothetical protein